MAGEGFAIHGIKSLKENRRQLRKRSLFKKERSFLNLQKGGFKTRKDSIELKKLSKEELLKYKERTIKSRTKDEFYYRLIAYIFTAFFSILCVYVIFSSIKQGQLIKSHYSSNIYEKKLVKYDYLILSGDNWLKERKYHNAVFQYQSALEIFPNDSLAIFRLITASDLNCEVNLNSCGESEKLLEDFINR